jgi:hypothetical protein
MSEKGKDRDMQPAQKGKGTNRTNTGSDPAAKRGASKDELRVEVEPGKSKERTLADIGLSPIAQGMATARLFTKPSFGDLAIEGLMESLADHVVATKQGDLSTQKAMLACQAVALNSIFTEMARRAAANMGEYIEATERYMRLALKAQAQSRATVEALERLTGGREQTVRHVHVDNRGGQAVIAETVHTGGKQIGKTDDQSHGTSACRAGIGPAVPGADPFGSGVPIPSREGQEAVQDARRDQPWSS